MRFEELIVQEEDGDLRVRFHPELTVVSGLPAPERRALAESVLGAVSGVLETTTLRYIDSDGRPTTLVSRGGTPVATHDDGATARHPLSAVSADPASLRSVMLLSIAELGVLHRASRDDDPPELVEARATLEELTAELDAALGRQHEVETLQRDVERIEDELRSARDGVARREYAQVLARLEQVRAEAAAVHAGAASIDSDRHLLASADAARALATTWAEADALVTELRARLEGRPHFEHDERDVLATIPPEVPEDIDELIESLERATAIRDALDQRLQILSVSKLPAPSDPVVAELGLLDRQVLWETADRLSEATEQLRRVQVSLGGVEVDDLGPPPEVVERIELAHAATEAADRAAGAAKVPGIGAASLGVAAGAIGFTAAPLLVPVGLIVTAVAVVAGIVRPGLRRARAARAERAALEQAEATSYLGFHIRRVEASVDPALRSVVESSLTEHRYANARWIELVGGAVTVERAQSLRDEVEDYHEAVRNLGDTAEEIEQLRRQLHDEADPRQAAARAALVDAIEPFHLSEADLDDPDGVVPGLLHQVELGITARAQTDLDDAEVDAQKAAAALDDLLCELGFDAGPLEARVGALEWAVSRAAEREGVRAGARPTDEIESELRELQESASALRRPEWATVTAADADTPDIPDLEARLADVVARLADARVEVDVDRLADRQAAVERRVAAL